MTKFLSLIHRYGIKKTIQFIYGELYILLWCRPFLNSYSQYKEDLLLDQMLSYKKKGFYIDIGAYDPNRFSNTMRFYRRGWHGINIEPNTEHYRRFVKARARDINCNIGIGLNKGNLMYYHMDPATLSTFVKRQAEEYERKGFALVETKKIPVFPLKDICKQFAQDKRIDFISIDVEGQELAVLKSNDWKKYRPKYICIESSNPANVRGLQKSKERMFLEKAGYHWISDNKDNSFYKDIKN